MVLVLGNTLILIGQLVRVVASRFRNDRRLLQGMMVSSAIAAVGFWCMGTPLTALTSVLSGLGIWLASTRWKGVWAMAAVTSISLGLFVASDPILAEWMGFTSVAVFLLAAHTLEGRAMRLVTAGSYPLWLICCVGVGNWVGLGFGLITMVSLTQVALAPPAVGLNAEG
ncbi:YgjV family protein [Ferrimonas marina]|uniref:YgjV family protein n=1 Tax=Ferrimonas marina TaxID=299255 RepID=UPI000AE43122|nr:YgjV family protein [Ferrimonas marina]